MASEPDRNQPAKKPTLSTDQEEEEEQGQDFISLLPDQILHTILSKLQLDDAAVTTAVSKRWATLFPTLPSLEIDADSFNPRDSDINPKFETTFGTCESYVEDADKWLDALFSVLDSRKTAIKKFSIAVEILKPDANDFHEVFHDVCVAGVEELLIINTERHCCYQIPSPVFACNSIVKLEIHNCRLVVPSKLTGLGSVKSLELMRVTVADGHLRRMISRCKAMEKLVIRDCLKVKNIVISAPSLSELVINFVCPVGVVLKRVPQLASVAVSFGYCFDEWKTTVCYFGSDDEESDGGFSLNECKKTFESKKTFEGTKEVTNLVAFLNGLRCVKDLHLDFSNEYRMVFSKYGVALPTRLSPKCYLVELKKLCLSFPFNYNTFNMIISCLLNSSPHLMEIIICVDASLIGYKYCPNDLELNFWEKQLPAECIKQHLTTATFYLDYYLSEDCLVFPKFLLLNAGNLKNMNVFYTETAENIANDYFTNEIDIPEKIQNELFAIEKASPDVEIMVKPVISRQRYIPRF